MTSINQIFNSSQHYFTIYYSHKYKMYDFSIFDINNNTLIYHYHFSNLKDINKLIQEFK